MKLLFTVDRLNNSPAKKIIPIVDAFDPSFSMRYKTECSLGEFGTSVDLEGEYFWDNDKYHLFFVECNDEKIPEFIENMKTNDFCNYVSPVDDAYNACGEVLYISPNTVEMFARQKQEFAIPACVAERTPNFQRRNII